MLFSFRSQPNRRPIQRKRAGFALSIEILEDRSVPSTFDVLNVNDGGAGSLRQAIVDANVHVGADLIDFKVAGTIRLTSGALPAVTDPLDIDGTTAPTFAGTPTIGVDYNQFGGLQFGAGSAGSALHALALFNGGGAGVTLNGAGNTLIAGNYIGLNLDGTTPAGNAGNGVELDASSGNTIGGTAAQDRNVISGNQQNGIYLNASSLNHIVGNFIGLTASGSAALGNRLDGVLVQGGDNNLIGQSNPVTGVTYANTTAFSTQPISAWQGIRGADTTGQYLITGTSNANGLLFAGTMAGVGSSYFVNYPRAATTSVYGPNNLGGGNLQLVGSYKNADASTAAVTVHGFLFQGTTADLANRSNYRTIDHPGAQFNYVHSTMGGLVVGNYDSVPDHGKGNLPLGPGHAYLYDIAQNTFLTDIVFPGSLSNTAYGIWYNGGTSYTICGGYSPGLANNFANQDQPIGQGYLVDYDSATGQFSSWASFSDPAGTNYITHFESISSVEKGVYTLCANSAQSGAANPSQGSWVAVRRNADGSFGPAAWVSLNVPGYDPTTNISSSNSVFGNQVVGVVIGPGGTACFQATVNMGFQLSNVISGNGGDGIGLDAANNNQVAMNDIGTDASGTVALGNAANGILVTAGATGNLIGGQATAGNDPTNGVFVQPPLGNLISGNGANGVLINGQATQTTLSGNFIGTTASGNAALGNLLDGVAIDSADGNILAGCALTTNPFVYYNVISGNGANGLRITNSNNTTVQGNFFGLGADNQTAVGNVQNGVLVAGSSANTVMGGPIPLGNVDAANGQNGILVQDTASFFTSYNTFCGLAAFQTYTNLGNGADGIKITSTGGNILLRTNVITENGADGIEISGAATGVRVAGNIVGLNTDGIAAMGNKGNGIEVDGTAHGIIIGGPQVTFNIVPHNAISANGGNGVAIDGNAHDIQLSFSFIGTGVAGLRALGNGKAGVFVGPGTLANSIGSTDPSLFTVISGNHGAGVELLGTSGNTVVGALIGTDITGMLPLPNAGDGVFISNGFDNLIGRLASSPGSSTGGPANLIAFNGGNGVLVASGSRNAIQGNSIHTNTLLGIGLGASANSSQVGPVLTRVTRLPLATQVTGTLTSTPNSTFTIEFVGNTVRESSGRLLLGSLTATTDATGAATFTFFGPPLPSDARFITATATDAQNNTSEFSAVSPFTLPAGFSYDTATGVLTITGVSFSFTQATTAGASGLNTTYTFTMDGVAQTFEATALSRVVVNGVGSGANARLYTNDTYTGLDGQTHAIAQIVALEQQGGQLLKFTSPGNAYVFLQLNGFPNSQAYLGRADLGELFAIPGATTALVTHGIYSSIQAAGEYHFIWGAPNVVAYAANPSDYAIQHDGNGSSQFVVSGIAWSAMSGTDQGQAFANVANGFRYNTGQASHSGDTATFYDSPLDDLFIGGTSLSYLYRQNDAGVFTEFDQAIAFDMVNAYSFVGGYDVATNNDPSHNTTTGFGVHRP